MKKVLIINPFGIGDVLFTTPVIRAIKDAYRGATIGFWCNERISGILKHNPRVDKIFALSRGDIKKVFQASTLEGLKKSFTLVRALKRERFDCALDFSLDHRYSLIAKIIGIKQRIGFDYKNRGRFLTKKIAIDGYHTKHVVEFYMDLLEFLGIEVKTDTLELFVPERDRVRGRISLATYGVKEGDVIIGIAPGGGASWGTHALLKHWAAVKFAQLADRIIAELRAKVVLLGDKDERSIADAITYSMKHRAVDFVGKTSLEEFTALIRNLDVLVTNDGGPLHIGVALGIKTVSLFGPVDERVYGPYPPSENHLVIKEDIACRPCYKNFKMPLCGKNQECLQAITVGDVFQAVSASVLKKGAAE